MIRLSLMLFLIVSFTGCSKVLSERTDEQAWVEFDHEVRMARRPASVNDEKQSVVLQEALSQIPVRAILFRCGLLVSPEVCYRSEVTIQFDEVFHQVQAKLPELKAGEYRKEQKEFLEARSYENVADEVNRFHQSLLSGIDLKAREHAESLFRDCDSERSGNSTIENFGIFLSLHSEMPKSVYSCLSKKWVSDEDKLLTETADRLGLKIMTDGARGWIKEHQVSLVYEQEMNAILDRKQKFEFEQFQSEKEVLLKDFDSNLSVDELLKNWTIKLRERFPYSPVEQWVMKEKKR